MAEAKLKLYTNHNCPFAHRAHIVLAELGLPFDEEIIDLKSPRTPEYLAVNPRGLVPSLRYGDEIITESAIVAQFLADVYPDANGNTLLPPSTSPAGALARARIAFFIDAWTSKVGSLFSKALYSAKSPEEASAGSVEINKAIVSELEPLLASAAPFFGGSKKLTLAEAIVGPFILRLFVMAKRGVLPATAVEGLETKAPQFWSWAHAVIEHPSVTSIFDEAAVVENIKNMLVKLRGW